MKSRSVFFLLLLLGSSCEQPAFDPLAADTDGVLTRTDSTSQDSTSTGITITIEVPEWEVYQHLTF